MASDKNMDAWKAWAAKQPKNKEAIKKETSKKKEEKKKTTTSSSTKQTEKKKTTPKKKTDTEYKKGSTRDTLKNKRKRQMEELGI